MDVRKSLYAKTADANEQSHIGFLELKAVFLALNRYYKSRKGSRHIRRKSHNTTAIVYLNNMGGREGGWEVSVCKVQYLV